LEHARQIGMEEGLQYVYLGNVPTHPAENTLCPRCGSLLIERSGYRILRYSLEQNNHCPHCHLAIPIVGMVQS
jgi:pyruvate formate lyase activating enzyme